MHCLHYLCSFHIYSLVHLLNIQYEHDEDHLLTYYCQSHCPPKISVSIVHSHIEYKLPLYAPKYFLCFIEKISCYDYQQLIIQLYFTYIQLNTIFYVCFEWNCEKNNFLRCFSKLLKYMHHLSIR